MGAKEALMVMFIRFEILHHSGVFFVTIMLLEVAILELKVQNACSWKPFLVDFVV
jgi:hypothetical protein